jgi:hypothetical protein
MAVGYAVVFVVVGFATRARAKRVVGALGGGLAAAAFFLGAGVVGIRLGLWRGWVPSTTTLAALLVLATAISLAPTFPITWRVARRFGWRGLVVCVVVAAAIGPPRDYLIATVFPTLVTFSPGIAPLLGVASTYAGMVTIGHSAMRVLAGPARADFLARHASQAPSN